MQESVLLKFKLLTYKVQEYRLEKAWRRFEDAGFEPILIKGWAAAQVYPQPFERRFDDIDLIIEPRRYREAVEFLGEEDQTGVDLHECAKTLDNLSFDDLYSRSKTLKCGKADIRVLCPEDHLRILCVHWLIDGGAKKEKLWDIFYAVTNRPVDFDWERCLEAAGETRKRWIVCTISLAHKYLGLEIAETPVVGKTAEIPAWVINALEKEWQSDVFIIPLHNCFDDRKKLWQQIKKRLPPNPIQATIEMEGEFNGRSRIFYQIGDILWRFTPSVKRIAEKIFANNKTGAGI